MDIYLKLFEVLFPVFFIVGIGFLLGKKNPNFDTSFITTYAGNFGTPALVIFAITAGGYNSVNECLMLRLPSVIIPNYETSRDDQPGRAAKAAERGGSIMVEKADKGIIGLALDRICDPDVRSDMAERLVMSVSDDGAESLAESLLSN